MPRIDPLQLLKCLGVLLTPDGGIRSKEEVQRLANLMMKFSKKLVSKCVYILILKNTEKELLGMFMSAGGWTLVLTWLTDGIFGKNWALVIELLELLLICPVDVERLKSNSIPRLVKGLSKDEGLGKVNVLATRLVEQWLKIVKDETVAAEREVSQTVVVVNQVDNVLVEVPVETTIVEPETEVETSTVISPQSFYKLTVRDGKQVIAKVDSVSVVEEPVVEEEMTVMETETEMVPVEKIEEKKLEPEKKEKEHRSRHSSSKHRSSSSRSGSSSSHSSSNKDKNSTSSGSGSSSSSSSRDKSRDKDKSRDRTKDKYKHRLNGSSKHSSTSSNSSKDSKEKQAEKDKDTLAKIQPKSLDKLSKIPKKSGGSSNSNGTNDDKSKASLELRAKPSISIEIRKKDSGDRPKTVKVFNSKLRSTGLEEAAKPPPPRLAKKPSAVPVLPTKRPSPTREPLPPPEKRIKLPETEVEKPGGIKLIPAKPKPAFLQESDMFMDALAASATNKKEPKKRKRRLSISKDSNNSSTSPPLSPSTTAPNTPPLNSPISLKTITAPKFYKDTLETDDVKLESDETKPEVKEPVEAEAESEEPTENVVKEVDGLRGVLIYHKRKGMKKTVKWRVDAELEEVQYFELDETERVNVTKTFTDMKQMEHVGEREALQLSRKLPNEDLMDERTTWKQLISIDLKPPLAEPGKKSVQKDIQYAREKVILQALFFNKSLIPDSAAEPDPETHPMTDPVIIPLEDITGNPDSINDYQSTPWPDPKGSPPHVPAPVVNGPPMFSGMPPFNPPMGPPAFPQPFPQSGPPPPNFMPPPNIMGGEWRGMSEPIENHHGPPMFNRPDGFGMEENNAGFPPQGFGPPGPGPMGGPPPPGHMFPPNFPGNRGMNRGGFRNMGRGGWFRPAGPPPGWRGGGNHWGGRGGGGICKQYKMHGFCRQRDTCPFMHPQNNGPY